MLYSVYFIVAVCLFFHYLLGIETSLKDHEMTRSREMKVVAQERIKRDTLSLALSLVWPVIVLRLVLSLFKAYKITKQ